MGNAVKKAASILLCLVLVVIAFSGCSSDKDLNPSKLAEQIEEQTAFSQLKNISGTDLVSHFHFKDADVKSFSVMISASGESADTIACFELRSEEDQELIVSGISQYLTNLAGSLKATKINEFTKIDGRALVKIDNIVVLVICGDYKAVNTFLDGLDAREIV